MIEKGLVVRNAAFSVAQVVVVGLVFILLYRYLLETIGIDRLGVWSLVLAGTSVSTIANFGLTGSVVRFVAKYNARGDSEAVAGVMKTATFSISIFVAVFLAAVYGPVNWALSLLVPPHYLSEARALLPYAFIGFWLNSVAGVFLSGIDGFQLTFVRSALIMAVDLVYLAVAVLFVSRQGLIGLGYAQVIQTLALAAGSLLALRRYVPGLPLVPVGWDRRLFREMIGYGFNFQLNSIFSLLFEPLTKALLSRFGGLPVVGVYEMAARMSLQFRALVVNANKVIVPTIAHVGQVPYSV